MLCESAGVDFFETLKLLEPNVRETSFYPTIAEENNRNEAYLLLESAENLNSKLRLPTLARQVNENMVRHAVNLTQDTMRCCGKTLRRAKIAVLGTPKQKSGNNALVKMLEAKGAKVNLYDPLFSNNELSDAPSELKATLNEAVEGADCIIILTGQDQFNRLNLKKLRAIMKTPAAIVDLIGITEPQKVEKEGFTYRGLGRGAGKK
jgi:UDP-N-acetyl-D-mannosaminuronic acid dehydrogenase